MALDRKKTIEAQLFISTEDDSTGLLFINGEFMRYYDFSEGDDERYEEFVDGYNRANGTNGMVRTKEVSQKEFDRLARENGY
jgi:hypothetical protein